jgi:hypothetical protein
MILLHIHGILSSRGRQPKAMTETVGRIAVGWALSGLFLYRIEALSNPNIIWSVCWALSGLLSYRFEDGKSPSSTQLTPQIINISYSMVF